MNQQFTSRPLLKTGIVGLLLLPLLILINDLSPPSDKIPSGYNSSIIAFEFATSNADLAEVLGPLNEQEISDIDRLNYVDFGFMAMYGIFLFLFTARLGVLIRSKLLNWAKWLVPLAVIADLLENLQLLKLSDQFTTAIVDQTNTLQKLEIFTWSKWLLLSVIFLLIGLEMAKMPKSKWLGYILVFPFAFGVAAFVDRQRWSVDLFATSVFVGFFLIFVYCFFYKSKEISTS